MMRASEVRSSFGDSMLPPEAVGLFLLPQAMLTPMANSDAVTAAMIGPPGSVDFEAPAQAVLSELAASRLTTELAGQVRERMLATTPVAGDVWRFSVVITYHGLRSEQWRPSVQSETESYCLVSAGIVRISGRNGLLETSHFFRGVDKRSDDMPDPECKVLTEYSANGGMALSSATRDMAAVLAQWIVNRSQQYR